MFRSAFLASALLAAPALAAPAYYQAELAAPASQSRIVLRDVMWNCSGTGCSGGQSGSRPAIVCAVLAREVGALRNFSAGGKAIAPADLEKCNSRAK